MRQRKVAPTFICAGCKQTVTRKLNGHSYNYRQKYCSLSCFAKTNSPKLVARGVGWPRGKPRKDTPVFVCQYCHKTVERRRLYWNGENQGFDRRRFCNRECANSAQFKGGSIHHSGYRILTRNGKQIAEHREVIEKILGRTLHPQETVHHKNGDRQDNRPENLELWSTRNPMGQRVEDKIAFAKEFLVEYGYSVHDPNCDCETCWVAR